jgi:hypothetical protein
MTGMTEEDRARVDVLPLWANRLIDKLEADIADLQDANTGMFNADPEQVEVSLPNFNGTKYGDQPLPSHQSVRFTFPWLDGGPHIDVRLDKVRGGINISSSLGYRLYTLPDSSNAITVGVK